MRAGNKAGYNVAQHDGLLEQLEYDGGYCAQNQDERQVAYEAFYIECFHFVLFLELLVCECSRR